MRPRIEEWGVFTLVSAGVLYWIAKGVMWIVSIVRGDG